MVKSKTVLFHWFLCNVSSPLPYHNRSVETLSGHVAWLPDCSPVLCWGSLSTIPLLPVCFPICKWAYHWIQHHPKRGELPEPILNTFTSAGLDHSSRSFFTLLCLCLLPFLLSVLCPVTVFFLAPQLSGCPDKWLETKLHQWEAGVGHDTKVSKARPGYFFSFLHVYDTAII